MLRSASAAVLYESATLGQTGISAQELLDGDVGGLTIAPQIFVGVRFELTASAKVTGVGGHLIGLGLGGVAEGERGKIFAALISIEGEMDFPDSFELDTSDVVATT